MNDAMDLQAGAPIDGAATRHEHAAAAPACAVGHPHADAVSVPSARDGRLVVVTARARVDFSRPVHALLGLPFDAVDLDGATALVAEAVLNRTPCFLSTPNVNFVVETRIYDDFRHSVLHSDLSVADGMPIVWWARFLGVPLRQRVAGADLFERLATWPVPRPIGVFFFGGPPGVAVRASEALGRDGGGLRGAGGESAIYGPVAEMDLDGIVGRINASGADFVLVALGARKGQQWIEQTRARLKAPVVSHLGAVVNFAAAEVRRAPPWTRRVGLEWAWRIVEEPALWRRYARDGRALLRLLMANGLTTWRYLRSLRGLRLPPPVCSLVFGEAAVELRLQGHWAEDGLPELRLALARAASAARPLRVVMLQDTSVGTAAMGLFLLLIGYCRDAEIPLVFEVADLGLGHMLGVNGIGPLQSPPAR
jgi:N-acetylglucosaminyldiphosphoundecaprenol N-acetyl-beta-D-mannosaminyltransferase